MRRYAKRNPRWIFLAVLLALGACSNPWIEDAPTFDDILSAGWLEEDQPQPVTPLYCYDTIGAPDCHAEPIVGEGGRLRGYEGPLPTLKVER
jgi:hypothetical protein